MVFYLYQSQMEMDEPIKLTDTNRIPFAVSFPSFLPLFDRLVLILLTNLEILSPHPSSTVGEDGLDPNTKVWSFPFLRSLAV